MENVFLATTALECFWDTTKPIVFLGEWCKRYSRRAVWSTLNGQTVVDPWIQKRDIAKDRLFVTELYERTICHLARSLNKLHGINASERYWRILLGPWLGDYVTALYDRTVMLEEALSQFPNLTTTLLAEESFIVPRDSMEFNWVCSEDAYNLQTYSKILNFWGKDFPKKPMEIQVAYPGINNPAALQQKPLKRLFKRILRMFEGANKGFHQVVLVHSYFSNLSLLKIFFMSRGAVCPYFAEPINYPSHVIDKNARGELLWDLKESPVMFDRLLAHILPTDIPQVFVEGFRSLQEMSAAKYPDNPRAIFSSNAWYYLDDFKVWAATQAENGVPLIGTQHGGNYGSLIHHPSQDHELAIVDRYYSWGWVNGSQKIRPQTSTKLALRKRLPPKGTESSILFGTTCIPRYVFTHSAYRGVDYSQYLTWQSRFFDALPRAIYSQVRLRPHCVDYGWDLAERWKDIVPNVPVENWGISFMESLESSRVYICDHLSTTFIESITADKPTIVFWDTKAFSLRPEAQPFYDALRAVGILHHTPELAAEHLAAVYDDVEGWWNAPECRKARQEFCHQFARTSPTAIKEWARELRCL